MSIFPKSLVLVACTLSAGPALAGAINPAGNTSLCLDVVWGNSANGTAVQIATCSGDAAQNWTYTHGKLVVFGNKCLDVPNGNSADGTALQIWDCTDGDTNQNFSVNGTSLVFTAGNKCVDIPAANLTDGQHLQIWDCNGSAAQLWNGLPASSSGGGGGGGAFTGAIASVINMGVCLDVAGANTADGTPIQVANCSGDQAQTWTYNGTTLSALGKCLDVPGDQDVEGAKLQLWDCNGSAAQQWSFNGTTFQWLGGNNKCLDIPSSNATDGQRVQIWACNGTNAQNFRTPAGGGSTGGGGSSGGGTGGGSTGGSTGTPGWNLVWADEFNGSALDTSSWNYEVNCDGGGNNEDECYTNSPSNVSVANGVLSINVIKQGGLANGKTYTSGRINTAGKGMWTYGRFETSLKVPCGQGFWPAAWMMPQDSVYGTWPTSGELDIMEILGGNPSELFGTAHFGQPWPNQEQLGGTYTLSGGNFCGAFHQFALEWYPDHATWFVDGNAYFTLMNTSANWAPAPNWPFNERFYFILNVAMGGDWPGAPDPSIQSGAMEVDYVRVYAQQ